MRNLIFTLLLLTATVSQSQSLYAPCQSGSKNLYTEEGRFTVEVNRTAYGVNFEQRNPCLNRTLEKKIIQFFDTTTYKEFKKMGKQSIEIIRRSDGDYIYIPARNPSYLKL